MGLRGYLIKRSINTLMLIAFVISLNFVIFELMPGVQGSVAVLISNPRVRDPEQIDRQYELYNFCRGFESAMLFVDADNSRRWEPGETVVYDNYNNHSNKVYEAGEPIIYGSAPDPDTPLRLSLDIQYVDLNSNDHWDEGEPVVFDIDSDGVYDSGEFVMVGTVEPGTQLKHDGRDCIPNSALNRFGAYFRNMITLDFGISFQSGKPILHDMIQTGRFVNTLMLLGVATFISLVVGIFLGVYVAAKRGSFFDSGWVTVSLVTYSLPTFWMGLIFIMLFAQQLDWFPAGGVTPSTWILEKPPLLDQLLIRMQHLFLPAAVLTLFFYGGNLLLTRATMLEALGEDYITTARAKGLPERTVLFKHALKNASLPLVTNAALAFAGLLGGAIITETVFNWDGLGLWIWNSIGWKDFPVMQAMFYIIALCVIAANFISDILYGIIDPRIKYE